MGMFSECQVPSGVAKDGELTMQSRWVDMPGLTDAADTMTLLVQLVLNPAGPCMV